MIDYSYVLAYFKCTNNNNYYLPSLIDLNESNYHYSQIDSNYLENHLNYL